MRQPSLTCGPVVGVCLLSVSFAVVAAEDTPDPGDATLHWTNGDVLPGRLLGATATHLHWQSPLFGSPISIDREYLAAVRYVRPHARLTTGEPFCFTMRGKDILLGDLAEVTDEHIVARSRRHGLVRILRTAMVSVQRINPVPSLPGTAKYLHRRANTILLLDGQTLRGQIRALNKSSRTLSLAEQDGTVRPVELRQIAEICLADVIGTRARVSNTGIDYDDGTSIHGTIKSIEHGTLTLATAFCDHPVTAPMADARELSFLSYKAPPEPGGRSLLQFGGGHLHGQLVVNDASLSWQPVGAEQASRLPRDCRAELTANADAGSVEPQVSQFGDVLVLRNGDVLPGRIGIIDETQLQIKTAFSDGAQVPCDQVKAVELNAQGESSITGFGDKGWLVMGGAEDAAVLTDTTAVFRNATTLAYLGPLRLKEIRFDASWSLKHPVTLTVRLSAPTSLQPHATVRMTFADELLLVDDLRGKFVRKVKLEKRQACMRIAFDGHLLRVYTGETLLSEQPCPSGANDHRSLFLEVGKGGPAIAGLLTLSDFHVVQAAGVTSRLPVDTPSLQRLLSLNRHSSADPPTHVLVGQNNDLLRGRLLGISTDCAHFRVRHRELTIPRKRVARVIWLDPVEREPVKPQSLSDPKARIFLCDGMCVTLSLARIVAGNVLGEHHLLGQCRVPVGRAQQLQFGGWVEPRASFSYSECRLRPAQEPVYVAGGSADPEDAKRKAERPPVLGSTVEDLELQLLDGRRLLCREQRGKVLVLVFWASWSGPCLKAMPQLLRVTKTFPRDKVRFLAVNQQEATKVIESCLAKHGWQFEVALDADGRLGQRFRVETLPTTVIIGKSGKIERLYTNARDGLERELRRALQQLLTSP